MSGIENKSSKKLTTHSAELVAVLLYTEIDL